MRASKNFFEDHEERLTQSLVVLETTGSYEDACLNLSSQEPKSSRQAHQMRVKMTLVVGAGKELPVGRPL
jgi:hypothetical protein